MAFVKSLDWSGYLTKIDAPATTSFATTTTLLDTDQQFIPILRDATASMDFLLDSDGVAGNFPEGDSWRLNSPVPVTYCPFGRLTGNQALLYYADQATFSITSAVADAIRGSVSAQASTRIDLGTSVEDFTAITTNTTGTARDGGAGTTNGGVAHLHVSAYATLTSDAIIIEHSVDGSTAWATLVTFTSVTAVGSQRIEVAAGTTVRRYLRVSDTVVGSGSVTRHVAFARR